MSRVKHPTKATIATKATLPSLIIVSYFSVTELFHSNLGQKPLTYHRYLMELHFQHKISVQVFTKTAMKISFHKSGMKVSK